MILLAFSLGVYSTSGQHFANAHAQLGLTIFLLLLVQISLGITGHRTAPTRVHHVKDGLDGKYSAVAGKSYVRISHIVLGLTITIIGTSPRSRVLDPADTSTRRLGSDSTGARELGRIQRFWQRCPRRGHYHLLDPQYVSTSAPPPHSNFLSSVGIESAEVFLGRFLKGDSPAPASALTQEEIANASDPMSRNQTDYTLRASGNAHGTPRMTYDMPTGTGMARVDTETTLRARPRPYDNKDNPMALAPPEKQEVTAVPALPNDSQVTLISGEEEVDLDAITVVGVETDLKEKKLDEGL